MVAHLLAPLYVLPSSTPAADFQLYTQTSSDGIELADARISEQSKRLLDALHAATLDGRLLEKMIQDGTLVGEADAAQYIAGRLAADGLLILDTRYSFHSKVETDAPLIGDARVSLLEKTNADADLVADAQVSLQDKRAADSPLLSDTRTSLQEKVEMDAPLIGDARVSLREILQLAQLLLSDTIQRQLEAQFLDSLLTADFRTGLADLNVTDALLISDNRLSVLDRQIVDAVLLADTFYRLQALYVPDAVLLGEATDPDYIPDPGGGGPEPTLYTRSASDGLLLLSLDIRERHAGHPESVLLSDPAFRHTFLQLTDALLTRAQFMVERHLFPADSLVVGDGIALSQDHTLGDRVLLGDSAGPQSLREQLSSDALLLGTLDRRERFLTVQEQVLLSDAAAKLLALLYQEGVLLVDAETASVILSDAAALVYQTATNADYFNSALHAFGNLLGTAATEDDDVLNTTLPAQPNHLGVAAGDEADYLSARLGWALPQ